MERQPDIFGRMVRPRTVAGAHFRQFVLDLAERSFDGIDIPTVPIDEKNALKTVPHERHDDITNNDDKCRRLQRDGAGKRHVMLRHAVRQGRRH